MNEIIDLLRVAYMAEIETAINYLAHSVNLKGFKGMIVKDIFAKEAIGEMEHAQKIGKRISVLNGMAPGSNYMRSEVISPGQMNLQPGPTGFHIESVLRGVIEAESEAIEIYNKIINTATTAEDWATVDLAVEIMSEEEEHMNLFQSLLSEIMSQY